MEKTLKFLADSYSTAKTGQPNPRLLEKLKVSCYGSTSPLNSVAMVNCSNGQLIVVPFDKTLLSAIEKSIIKSNLGLNPQKNSNNISVPIPTISGEQRKKLVSFFKVQAEEQKVALRNIRKKARIQVKDQETSKDEIKKINAKIDQLTKQFSKKLDDIYDKKAKEILK